MPETPNLKTRAEQKPEPKGKNKVVERMCSKKQKDELSSEHSSEINRITSKRLHVSLVVDIQKDQNPIIIIISS